MKLPVGIKIILGFASSVIALSCIGWLSYHTIVRLTDTESRVARSDEVIAAIESGVATLTEAETAQRAYLLTGDEGFLQACLNASTNVEDRIATLRKLTAGNPSQQQRVARLDALAHEWLASLQSAINSRAQRTGSMTVDPDVIRRESELMERIRDEAGAMRAAERESLARFEHDAHSTVRISKAAIWMGSVLACALGFVALVIIRSDLMKRDAAEQALRHSEERLRLMVEAVKDYAIVMLDPAGCVISWNAGSQRIKGYSAEEIIGQHFSRFYPEDIARNGLPEKMLATAAAEGRADDQGWRVRKDGSRFWADVVITAVRDANGPLIGFVKITRDLTERRQAEQKIQELNDDLQRRANQLQVANSELEAFSYSVSHDLRAPLRHIHGFVGLLKKAAGDSLDEQGRHYLHVISDSARQMGLLIDDLLVFSRMGRAEMQATEVNLEKMAGEVMQGLQAEAPDRKIAWHNGGLPRVYGDPAMLRQVWVNLLSNAMKYTRQREAAEIEVGHSDTPNEHVVFVRDNGVGFEMEYAHKLFGVFQRLHSSGEFEGTGIGLAIVRRIISRHGGRTWAEGRVNEGATFYFSLPKHQKERL